MEAKKQGRNSMHFSHLMLQKIKKILLFFAGFLLFYFSNFAFAAYTFTSTGSASGAPNCTGNSSGVYNCTSGFDNNNETTTINNASGPVTINITGEMRIRANINIASPNYAVTFNVSGNLRFNDDNNSIRASNGSTTYTNVVINVRGSSSITTTGVILATIKSTNTGSITVTSNPTIYGSLVSSSGNISAFGRVYGSIVSTTGTITKNSGLVSEAILSTSGAINLLNSTSVKHITCDCALTVAYGITVTGNIQVASMTETDSQNTYNGSIYTTTGRVNLKYSSDVVGSITSATTVQLEDQNTANSCVKSTSSSTITLGWGVNANSVCCGGSCSNSCVTNNSSYSMPSSCTTEQVVINASGDQFYGTYPIMELWVNGTKHGSVSVTGAAKDYFFNVALPATITSLDVVFPNDDANSTEDRNLILNTVTIRGNTLRPTDSGVIIDWGDSNSYSTFFDGITTVPGQVGVWWESAVRFVPNFNGNLIASYSLDEASWNGSLNEAKDTAGYTGGPFDGQGIGSPIPTPANSSPARSGVTGTCGYATFSGNTSGGSAFTLDGLPVSTTAGAKTSVSFWMYWNGTNAVMPIGWNSYDLWFSGGFFGFNTANSDIYGISSSGLANGWHHVAAVFTNGGVTSNKIYIDGVNQSLSQRLSSPANSNAVVQSTIQVSGWTRNNGYRFVGGRVDQLKIYNGEISSTQVTADYNATHACPSYSETPSSFNCVATGANASTGRLYTQLAGTAFNVDVVALNASNAVETNYVTSGTKNVTLEFVDGSGSIACASRTALSPAISQTVTFAASDAGRKSAAVTINKAYQNLRCRVTDSNSTPVTACSSDNFAVRPNSLTISSTNANADSTGSSASATPAIKAGTSFAVTATADVTGYNGTPTIDSSKLSAHSGATTIGSLSGSFSAANASTGTATGSAFNFSEVGYFRLAANGIYDSTFTAVDSANGDCTAGFTVSGGINACSFGNTSTTAYFGRFIPDHFTITAGSNTEGCDSGNFTYFGQDGLTTTFTIRAENSANAVTQNYTGSFAKLGLTSWSNYIFSAATLPAGSSISASSSVPSGSWSNGLASVSAKHQISRPTSATAPTNITIYATPVDSDGVTVSSASPVSSATPFLFGRLWMSNVYGSELLNLTVPIEAQYWSSNGVYQRNQLDSCTAIAPANIAMGSYKGNLAACETVISGGGTMASGKTTMTLSKPGNGNNGSVDLSINLNSAAGSTCTSTTASSATSASLPQFGTTNPSARETFGLFKSPVIYMRENY